MQDVCIENGNLKVEKESAVLENVEYTKLKKVHEDRARDSKTFSDEKKKAEIMNKDLMKQREYLHDSNLTSTTTCETQPKVKYLSDTGGHPKADSVKRGCLRSIILDEEKNKNFKVGEKPFDMVSIEQFFTLNCNYIFLNNFMNNFNNKHDKLG